MTQYLLLHHHRVWPDSKRNDWRFLQRSLGYVCNNWGSKSIILFLKARESCIKVFRLKTFPLRDLNMTSNSHHHNQVRYNWAKIPFRMIRTKKAFVTVWKHKIRFLCSLSNFPLCIPFLHNFTHIYIAMATGDQFLFTFVFQNV